MQVPERDEVFRNHGVLQPVLRVILAQFLFLVVVSALTFPLLRWVVATHPGAPLRDVWDLLDLIGPAGLVVAAWLQLVAALGIAAVLTRRLDCQSLRALGLWRHAGWQRELGAGLALGALLIAGVFLALVATGLALVEPSRDGWIRPAALGLVLLAPLALSEEIWFRGYVQRNLTQGLGAWPALILTSAFFAVAHFSNPEKSAPGFLNIGLAGMVMGYAYLRSGSLWLPSGLHLTWNFTQSTVLGMPVSGIGLPSILETALKTPHWISGGSFGPEGGLAGTVALGAGLAYLAWRYRGARPPEVAADTPEPAPPAGE
ncbi:MAG: CPBP family intramembrane metalloprotease [Armatimonadetes bacterium]|nr:CPBP family intramembrane metalloprotease [Armatimonadota bacterium]